MTDKEKDILGDSSQIREFGEPTYEIDIPLIVLVELGIHPDKGEDYQIQFVQDEETGRVYLEKA